MRYSYILTFKNEPPFDRDPETTWNSFLGEFVKPIAERFPDLLFWSSFYDDHAAFRVHSDSEDAQRFIEDKIASAPLIFDPQEEIGVTLLLDLGHPRFVNHSLGGEAIQRRADLTLSFLCSTTRLYLDGLILDGKGYWSYQITKDDQNPEGHNFQSVHHLFCNISRVPTMIQEVHIPTKNGLLKEIQSPFAVFQLIDRMWDRTIPCTVSNPQRVHF